ncbi:MAG: hypothetical protein AAFZ15_09600 [Bacteroidota bacterium]
MKNYLLNCCLLVVLSLGCSSLRFDSPVVYEYRNKGMGVNSKLILDSKDMTFTYSHLFGLITQSSHGKWEKREDELILNSDSVLRSGFIRVQQTDNFSTPGKVKVKVIDEKTNGAVAYAEVSFNGDESKLAITNDDGETLLGTNDITSIGVGFLGEYYTWDFTDKLNGDLNILLTPKDITKAFFENETWKFSGRKLVAPSGLVYKPK